MEVQDKTGEVRTEPRILSSERCATPKSECVFLGVDTDFVRPKDCYFLNDHHPDRLVKVIQKTKDGTLRCMLFSERRQIGNKWHIEKTAEIIEVLPDALKSLYEVTSFDDQGTPDKSARGVMASASTGEDTPMPKKSKVDIQVPDVPGLYDRLSDGIFAFAAGAGLGDVLVLVNNLVQIRALLNATPPGDMVIQQTSAAALVKHRKQQGVMDCGLKAANNVMNPGVQVTKDDIHNARVEVDDNLKLQFDDDTGAMQTATRAAGGTPHAGNGQTLPLVAQLISDKLERYNPDFVSYDLTDLWPDNIRRAGKNVDTELRKANGRSVTKVVAHIKCSTFEHWVALQRLSVDAVERWILIDSLPLKQLAYGRRAM